MPMSEMIGVAAERSMELQIDTGTCVEWGEKSKDQLMQCSGYRKRDRETRAETVELRISCRE